MVLICPKCQSPYVPYPTVNAPTAQIWQFPRCFCRNCAAIWDAVKHQVHVIDTPGNPFIYLEQNYGHLLLQNDRSFNGGTPEDVKTHFENLKAKYCMRYSLSQRARKRVEEIFGWLKTVGTLHKLKHRGRERVGWIFTLATATYNMVRMRNIELQGAG